VFDRAFRFNKEDPEIYKRAREMSVLFEQKAKDIENVSLKEVLNKAPNDPYSAANEVKNVAARYHKELQQKMAKDGSSGQEKQVNA